jgi:CelD/BcsL family acetyltransferase involved in cellulose biosynthesis
MAHAERPRVVVAIVDGAAGLVHLRDEWQALYQQSGRELSLSYAWSNAVASVYARPGDRIRIVTLRRDGVLVGVLPLIRCAARRAFGHLTPLAEEHSTHSDWLVAECSSDIADALVEGLMAAGVQWDRFRMSGLLEHNALLPHVVAALRRHGLRILLRRQPPSHVLRLPATYAVYLGARSAKFRNHLKRVQKKVEARRTEVTVVAGSQSPSAFTEAFARILAIEQTSWKQAHRWAMSSDGAATEFWRQVCAGGWAEGRIHVQFLCIDGRPAAYNLGYIIGDEYAYLKTTFASEFKELGAATFLRGRLVEDLIARGIRLVDFPGEPYDWERQWTDEVRGHIMLTAYSGSVRSRLLEVLERMRHVHDTRVETPSERRNAMTVSY